MKRAASWILLFLAVLVLRAVDGDTLLLEGGERVRLIGVDTPEIAHEGGRPAGRYGEEAAAFAKREMEGREVRLEYEGERLDKYGRTLAYVYREPDGFFLNAEIVKQGFGRVYGRFPFGRIDEFREYQRAARANEAGLWGIIKKPWNPSRSTAKKPSTTS